MKKTVLLYGVLLAGLLAILKVTEYNFYIKSLSIEFYIGIIATFFTAIGIWVGLKLTRKKIVVVDVPFEFNTEAQQSTGISKRELEVLQLMADGLSNQEIADKLFVSLNTVKTHSANLFSKLGVNKRMQAIQKAKELSLIR